MLPAFHSDDPQVAQKIYDRGVYAGILLLLWLVIFLEFRHPIVGVIVAACLSTFLLSLYTPLLRWGRHKLEKHISSVPLRQSILLAVTLIYILIPLWQMHAFVPVWITILATVVLTASSGYQLFQKN